MRIRPNKVFSEEEQAVRDYITALVRRAVQYCAVQHIQPPSSMHIVNDWFWMVYEDQMWLVFGPHGEIQAYTLGEHHPIEVFEYSVRSVETLLWHFLPGLT